jgi:hypothetical protein
LALHRAFGDAPRPHRRVQDRGLFWVRITLVIVISALLLGIVGSSRARHASGSHSEAAASSSGP